MSVQIDGSTGNIIAIKADYSGDVSIGGTLTYEDVTNVDSVGIITARSGVNVTGGSVGIGTDSPVSGVKLHLQDTSACRLQLSTNSTGHTSSDGVRLMIDSSNNFEILNREEANIEFFTNNSERARIDSAGRLLVATTSARTDFNNGSQTAQIQLEGTSADTSNFALVRNSANTGTASLIFGKSRASGDGGVTVVNSGDTLGSIDFEGADGTDLVRAALIRCEVDGTPGANDMPGRLVFSTTADGASSTTERMRIDSSGNVGVGAQSPDGTLHVHSGTAGSVTANGNADDLIVESSGTGGISILTPDASHGYIIWGSPTSNEGAIIRYRDSDNLFTIGTEDSDGQVVLRSGAGSEAARFDSSGNFGLGTTSPSEIIDVIQSAQGDAATLRIRNSADSNASTNVEIVARQASRTGGRIVFGRENANAWSSSAGYADGFISFNPTDGGSDVERMRIDSSGRLLVGTSSNRTGYNLQLEGTSGASAGASFIRNEAGNSGGTITLGKSGGTSNGSFTVVSDNDTLGSIIFTGADGTASKNGALIQAFVDGTPGSNDMPGRLVFSTTADGASSPTERMRIRSNGTIVGSTNTSDSNYFSSNNTYHLFHSDITNNAVMILEHSGDSLPYGLLINFNDAAPDDNTRYAINFSDTSGSKFRVYSDGDVVNADNSYGSISDQKLKQDIVDAGSQWDDIKELRVRNFKFKSDVAAYGDEAKTLIGLVAQEAELVSPGIVKDAPDLDADNNDLGTVTKLVNYSVLYMKAVKALQEAQTRIETLETQKTAQQTQIDDLLARVNALEG